MTSQRLTSRDTLAARLDELGYHELAGQLRRMAVARLDRELAEYQRRDAGERLRERSISWPPVGSSVGR